MKPEEIPLTILPVGESARVVRIDLDESLFLCYGIYPGVQIRLEQTYPAYVLRCDHTELALEYTLASKIWVRRIPVSRVRSV